MQGNAVPPPTEIGPRHSPTVPPTFYGRRATLGRTPRRQNLRWL